MKAFPIYHMFEDFFTALQPALVEIVVKAAAPDAIFLLGAAIDHRRSESIFTPSAPTAQYIGACTVLVLLPEGSGKEVHEWQDQVEAHCLAALLPVTALVVRTSRFAGWLQEKHRFALTVRASAPLLYDAGRVALPLADGEVPTLPDKAAEKIHTAGVQKAGEFLAGAELFRLRRQYAMAAFMLHQAAEQSLDTLVKTGTGFSANTHSIDRLLRYAALVSFRVAPILPQRTEKDKRLFRLLQKAYIDSRYEDYSITEDELRCLTGRVEELHRVVRDFGKTVFTPKPVTAEDRRDRLEDPRCTGMA
jgi:HEPN domain-containing protein